MRWRGRIARVEVRKYVDWDKGSVIIQGKKNPNQQQRWEENKRKQEKARENKRKQAPSGWKCSGLRGWEQLCGGCVQKDITSLCWLFRKYRLLTQISQLGGLRKAVVFLPPASKICQVNLQVSTSFSLGGVIGFCAHANRFYCGVCSTPCVVGIIICFIPCDYPAWEKSVRIYSLWNNLLFSYLCSVACAP